MIPFNDGNSTSTYTLDSVYLDEQDPTYIFESYFYVGLTVNNGTSNDSYAIRVQNERDVPRVDWMRRLDNSTSEFLWNGFIVEDPADTT